MALLQAIEDANLFGGGNLDHGIQQTPMRGIGFVVDWQSFLCAARLCFRCGSSGLAIIVLDRSSLGRSMTQS